ncbi:MAG TPA: ABC transporter permease subunit [Steroidobacteraceae bacterium]|jgi:sodium transport system permease protein|nr:ABC transporter permease subunit [Steroidobacteraceae bacterium]
MKAIWRVFIKEVRENLRDRRTVISALIFGPLFGPLLISSALSLSFRNAGTQDTRPLYLTVSHAERAPELMAYLRQYNVRIRTVEEDQTAARQEVAAHHGEEVLLVPDDFGSRIEAGQPAPLLLFADESDTKSATSVERIDAIVNQYGTTIARLRLVARGLDPLLTVPIALHAIDISTPAARSALALGTLSYLVLLTMLMGGMYLAIDATAGERERGSLEPLLTVPVRREYLIYGKIMAACAYMTLSLVLTVTAFAISLRFVGLERVGMSADFGLRVAVGIVLACLPLVPLGAALMTLVAAFTRSYREAQTYVGLVLLIPTLPLVFAAVLGLQPRVALMAIPSLGQHFIILSLIRMQPLPAAYVALSACSTLVLAALFVFAAGRLYRRESLLG